MPLSVEQLMRPRIKIIAPYPHCPFDVGSILLQDKDTIGEVWVLHTEISDVAADRRWVQNEHVNSFLHLFKPLQWHEDRLIEDMPEYVRYIANGNVSKLTQQMVDYGAIVMEDYLPATLAEYTAYINSKQNSKS